MSKHGVYDLVKKFCLKGVAKESPGKKGQVLIEKMKVFIEELKKNDELAFTTIKRITDKKMAGLKGWP